MSFSWTHFERDDPGLEAWLSTNVPDIPAEALVQVETRPRCDRYEDGLILNLRGVNLNEGAELDDMVSLRLWVTKEAAVSVRVRRVFALDAIREASDPPDTAGAFLSDLVTGLTDRIETVVLALTDEVDAIEDQAFDAGVLDGEVLAALRRRTIKLRRYIAPQRDAMVKLAAVETPVLSKKDQLRLREPANRMMLALEALDAAQARVAVLQDHHDTRASMQQARHGYVLSVVAAIFLPLGFLTGLFGMNVAGLPGTDWPLAFVALSIGMVAIAVGLIALFRWMKWL